MQESPEDNTRATAPVTSLVAAIRRQIAEQPGATALVSDGVRISYGELGAAAERATAGLAALQLGPGTPVAIVGDKSPEAIALILASLATGRPALLPSTDLGAQALEALLQRAGCSHVLTAGATVQVMPATAPGAPPPGAPALLLTTSGSTGVPKLVPLAIDALDAFTTWAGAHFDIRPGFSVLNYAPLNFDLCLLDIWATLARGGCAVLVDKARSTDGRYLAELIEDHDVRLIQGVPLLFHLLTGHAQDAHRHSCVEHVVVTGEPVPIRTLTAMSRLFTRAVLHNLYGCTETNDSFIYEIDVAHLTEHDGVPIGAPLPGVATRIVGPDGADADAGELWVSTAFQTTGYQGAGVSDGRFVERSRAARPFFRTGDLVKRHPDGCLTVAGRTDFQVKVRGVRTNLNELEAVLLAHPCVAEAAVVALPDEIAGNRLRALVRASDGAHIDPLELRSHCAARLARAAIPSSFTVSASNLPKTNTGKVDRLRVRDLVCAQRPKAA